ncbi:MAG: exo-alpha-sialidase, partial [Chloroflexi bacterium]
SSVAANPRNPLAMVGASKRFTDPTHYGFTLAAYFSTDGGQTWQEAPPLQLLSDPDPNKTWAGTSDPVVAWDDMGNVYLVALPFPKDGGPYFTLGIAVYRSSDGGATWSPPNFIHPHAAGSNDADDKQDGTPASPRVGNVYAAWDTGQRLSFARSTDHGATWAVSERARRVPDSTARSATRSRPRSRSGKMARCTSSGAPARR